MKEISRVLKKEYSKKTRITRVICVCSITLALMLVAWPSTALALEVVEEDYFPNSKATVTISTPFLPYEPTINLSGPTTVHVFFDEEEGHTSYIDTYGMDYAETEIVSMELEGYEPSLGQVFLRLRPYTMHPNKNSTGRITERANSNAGILDVPPFTTTGTADSYFDVYFELEIPALPDGYRLLHNSEPKRMSTIITHKPPATDETYEDPERIELFNETDFDTPIAVILATHHTPKPAPVIVLRGSSFDVLGLIILSIFLIIISIFTIRK